MLISKTLISLVAYLAPVFAHPAADVPAAAAAVVHSRCGAKPPSAKFLLKASQMAVAEAQAGSSVSLSARAVITVKVYVHVVASSTANSGGYINQAQVNLQMQYMNNAYASAGFQFYLQGTDWTVNSLWANDGAELAMKKALRKGTYKDLNLYFLLNVGGAGSGLLGYCYFPGSAPAGSNNFYLDGCSVAAQSVPGGTITNYNLGGSAAHETGHWMGLMHTFQGGCTGTGDSVADTPAQGTATAGCPSSQDSCPSVAGLDPIHNYMDYSYDSCYTNFTPGQATRMLSMWNTYRAAF